jgi:hypothetical protein
MPQIVSANRLSDGIVVFLARDGRWVERLADAHAYPDAAAAKEGLAIAEAAMKANAVIEIAAFEVTTKDGTISPSHLRDRIRAAGPTVHRDHGKQAL